MVGGIQCWSESIEGAFGGRERERETGRGWREKNKRTKEQKKRWVGEEMDGRAMEGREGDEGT